MRISDHIARQAEEMAAQIAEEQQVERARVRVAILFDRALALIGETYKKDRRETLAWLQDDAHQCWEGTPQSTYKPDEPQS